MVRERLIRIGRAVPEAVVHPAFADTPDWIQASARRITRSLAHAQSKNAGGWCVLGASRHVHDRPVPYVVAGHELVAFRSRDGLVVAPDACPHLGARLSEGCVRDGNVICPWHGLALGAERHGPWRPLPSYDDGVLLWVRIDSLGETPLDLPRVPTRPEHAIDAVIEMDALAEPEDVIANRLDPWHGAHFHPHSFARLRVLDWSEELVLVRVAFRVAGPFVVEVDARFDCADARTVTMTIVRGDGAGSVVETHATPTGPGRCRVIEATLAASDRKGFAVARGVAPLVRAFAERRARRLWVEDVAYAERRYSLRQRGVGAPKRRLTVAEPRVFASS